MSLGIKVTGHLKRKFKKRNHLELFYIAFYNFSKIHGTKREAKDLRLQKTNFILLLNGEKVEGRSFALMAMLSIEKEGSTESIAACGESSLLPLPPFLDSVDCCYSS